MMKGEESKAGIKISSMKSEEGGISWLPDCLLVEIISRLPETKYAIRTGTLSKRWQHLWTQLPNLIIDRSSQYNIPQFYSSVERIISQSNNLIKLKLHSNYTYQTESHVNNCIRNAITRNAQEVDFYMSYYPDDTDCDDTSFVLPDFFFISSSFIRLKLSNCTFKQADVVSWENLTTLLIEQAEIEEHSIKNILSGSPLLETLMLHGCYGFERIDITTKSVKNLVFSGDDGVKEYTVEINAPYILSLTIQGCLPLGKLLLLNVSSVIEAELNYFAYVEWDWEGKGDEVKEETLEGLLLSLGHAKEVIIGGSCLEDLAGLKAKGFTFPSNLKVLGEIDSN